MFIIEVVEGSKTWVVGVYKNLETCDAYFSKLNRNLKPGYSLIRREAGPKQFPLFAIELAGQLGVGETGKYFEYTDAKGLIKGIDTLKKVSNDETVFFVFYRFTEEFSQDTPEVDLMGTVFHEQVDNGFLQENYALYGEKAKADLAINGYRELLYQMLYDFGCGKLTQEAMPELLPLVEKAELLQGKDLWQEKGDALIALLENAVVETPQKVVEFANQAISVLNKELEFSGVGLPETYKKLATAYAYRAEYSSNDKQNNWIQAVGFMKFSVETDPTKTDWHYFLKLLYLKSENDDASLKVAREAEKEKFRQLALAAWKITAVSAYCIAIGYQRFLDYLDCLKLEKSVFLQTDYLFWIEQAKQLPVAALSGSLRSNVAGYFFQKVGQRLGRVDLLLSAVDHFSQSLDKKPFDAFTVLYIASCYESIADLYKKQGDSASEACYLNTTTDFYAEHLISIKTNFSVLIQYAEFLEHCLNRPEAVRKESIEGIRVLALQAAEDGNGYYSTPGILLAKLSLRENAAKKVLFYVTRELLLHELCMKKDFEELLVNPDLSAVPEIKEFLQGNLQFMHEVAEGYYLSPAITWLQVKAMSAEELAAEWGKRQQEFKNRPRS